MEPIWCIETKTLSNVVITDCEDGRFVKAAGDRKLAGGLAFGGWLPAVSLLLLAVAVAASNVPALDEAVLYAADAAVVGRLVAAVVKPAVVVVRLVVVAVAVASTFNNC